MHTEIPDVIALSSGDNPPGCDDPGQQLAPSEAPGKGETILVVDDSLAWLRLAREILTAGGYQAQTCEDPREALSLLEQNPERIDLVITDLQMPGLDGIELAAELLKIKPTLPVVLTSAAIFQMPSEETSVCRNSRFPAQALGPWAVVFYYPASLGEQAV